MASSSGNATDRSLTSRSRRRPSVTWSPQTRTTAVTRQGIKTWKTNSKILWHFKEHGAVRKSHFVTWGMVVHWVPKWMSAKYLEMINVPPLAVAHSVKELKKLSLTPQMSVCACGSLYWSSEITYEDRYNTWRHHCHPNGPQLVNLYSPKVNIYGSIIESSRVTTRWWTECTLSDASTAGEQTRREVQPQKDLHHPSNALISLQHREGMGVENRDHQVKQ